MLQRTIIAAIIVTLFAASTWAAERYAGHWKRTSLKLTVKIESWGEDCGPEPRSYGSGKEVETDLVAQGKHLVFSTGNLRTDRCMSPNPRLQSVSESVGSGSWKRVCQTPSSDSKSERVEYSLTASGTDRIDYRALSRFDWKLKGDHCVATLEETRVYVRVAKEGEPPPAEKPAAKKSSAESQPLAEEEGTDCAVHGPARRLVVSPREARIGPGERACFTAHGLDDGGCRFPVGAAWVATQDDQEVGGLLSRGGCFSAGANAADSEGVYEVVARFEGKKASARVVVAFPDLGDLLAARLRPAADEDEDPEDGKAAAASPPVPVPAIIPDDATALSPPADGKSTVLLLAAIGGILLVAVALLVIVLVIRGRARRSADDEEEDDEGWSGSPLSGQRPDSSRRDLPLASLPPEPAAKSPEEAALVCPKCKARFPAGAKYCPHDGSTLEEAAATQEGRTSDAPGMICPKCHRPYEAGSRFCPHDKELLIPYSDWRERQRGL